MAKRQWSRAFTPRDNGKQIGISAVPASLVIKFRAKCRREGISQRNLILGWVRNWVEGRRPDDDAPALPAEPAPEPSSAFPVV